MSLHESGEDYLETIYLLTKKSPFVRSVDVANELGFTKASVSRAMRILREEGLIVVGDDGGIKLTKAGSKRAISVYERHTLITDFFSQFLGVNPYIQYLIRGLIIILAVSIDVRKYIVKK